MRTAVMIGGALLAVVGLAACTRDGGSAPSPASAPTAAAPAPLPPGRVPTAPTSTSGPDVSSASAAKLKANYDGAGLPPDPRAVALCEALHTVPVVRKAECVGAGSAGFMITPMCVETLTAALALGKISLAESAVTACASAMKAATEDCGFAKDFGTPLPPACDGLFTGSIARGGVCRSSMECEAGMQCFGVGPSDLGRCTPPAPPGTLCGSGVDALATYTRQVSVERTRPACDGYCRLNRCQSFVAVGGECVADLQCGPGARCAAKKCAKS